MRNPGAPAPPPAITQTTAARTDGPHRASLHIHTSDGLAGEFMRRVTRAKTPLTGSQAQVLKALVSWINAGNLSLEGNPIVWPTVNQIRERCIGANGKPLGRAIVFRAIQNLAGVARTGKHVARSERIPRDPALIRRLDGGGKFGGTTYELLTPSEDYTPVYGRRRGAPTPVDGTPSTLVDPTYKVLSINSSSSKDSADASAAGAADERIEALRKNGVAERFIPNLLAIGHCTIEQIRIAAGRADFAKPKNRGAYVADAIANKYPPLRNCEQLRFETLPEYRQEDLAAQRLQEAGQRAEKQRAVDFVAGLDSGVRDELIREQLARAPDEGVRAIWSKSYRKNPPPGWVCVALYRQAGELGKV